VSFLLGVSGAEGPFTVAVTYGDGSSGTNPDAPHTYAQAGAFTAAFTVATATQSARCSTAVSVQAGPSPRSNQPPQAVFKTTPDAVAGTIRGTAPLDVRFNMCASSDPEGDRLLFLMDFDGDGQFDHAGTTGAHCRTDHSYAAGTWTARNCLRDVDSGGQARHDDECRTYTVVATP
jgi:PKD repeat protein